MATRKTKSTTALCTVLDPRGQPTMLVQPQPLASRLDSIEGKTVYLIDVGFGGGWEFLEEMVGWFSRNLPDVKTLRANYLNIRDLLGHDYLIMLKGSLPVIEGFLG